MNSDENLGNPARPVVSFVRRSARMTAGQALAFEEHGERYLVAGLARGERDTQFVPQDCLELSRVFGREAPLVVEIGSGGGETLVAGALVNPEVDFVGFEVLEKVIGATLAKLNRAQVSNVRVVQGDAVSGLEHLFLAGSVSQVWTFFPDPWAKRRQNKRRLISAEFAALVASRLVTGGFWRIATDWDDYARHIEDVLGGGELFSLVSRERFETRPVTKFERRALEAGREIHDFCFQVAR